MASIEEFAVLVTPPGHVEQKDWLAVNRELGFETPGDYQLIIDHYGRGSFDDFLYVMQPLNDNKFLDLASQIAANHEMLHALTNETIPYPVESLFKCASTDNGDSIYWLTDKSSEPNEWPIVINAARDDRWEEFDGTLLEFLVAIFSKSYVCPIFPDDFPAQDGSYFTPSA
ncbi:Uncharacterised protein [Mycobacteroides abscessus subsp. abscessus]|uniref:SMI1/KNR4 family protein n=2 Tax=Bacteria TaxID=2 RepID=A0A0U1BCZ3_9MYCO|nr:hypothetical protein [Mycobacteroides abscessus]AMU55107.1 hypothetical protein A3O02_07935 [Mycobacteroides abscessus]AMU69886.1 hypothetical protein A3O05_07385 [Mycobacteroides abscessus]AWG51792.1 hypothetical protein DDT48_21985 [Mycobacteroides abscessus]AWG65892.1 hypothetical protein DDT46_20215 [Mycobacteroides abscessus]EIC69977.1 hypothetical protein S7W_06602 [Mycobacteroides abscessus M94]